MDQLPSVYLGIPFLMGTNKITFWFPIIDRISARISTWKARWLSLSSRILLVKVVLTVIPNYYLSILNAPSSISYFFDIPMLSRVPYLGHKEDE